MVFNPTSTHLLARMLSGKLIFDFWFWSDNYDDCVKYGQVTIIVKEKWCGTMAKHSHFKQEVLESRFFTWKSFDFERLCPLGQTICPGSLRNLSSHETMVPLGKWPQVLGKHGYLRQMCSSSPRNQWFLEANEYFSSTVQNFFKKLFIQIGNCASIICKHLFFLQIFIHIMQHFSSTL